MNAVQIFALETFLERNYFASDEEGTIASLGCASFSTYLTNSDEESYCFSLYLDDLLGYEFSKIDEDYVWDEEGLEDRLTLGRFSQATFPELCPCNLRYDF